MLHQIQIHRWLGFTADGRGRRYCVQVHALHPGQPMPGLHNAHEGPGQYIRSVDDLDDLEHWWRMEAEAWGMAHPHPEVRRQASPRKLVHTGAYPHPHFGHVKLGGSFAWESEPHEAVAEHMAQMQAMTHQQLVDYLAGPGAFEGLSMGRIR